MKIGVFLLGLIILGLIIGIALLWQFLSRYQRRRRKPAKQSALVSSGILDNQLNYEQLLLALQASQGILNLFVAVCDRPDIRNYIISRCELDVAPRLKLYRVELDMSEPDLHKAIAHYGVMEPGFGADRGAVLMVTEAEGVLSRLDTKRSELEQFFRYVQGAQKGLGSSACPVVLWVTGPFLAHLRHIASDFESWHCGIFQFTAEGWESRANGKRLVGFPETTSMAFLESSVGRGNSFQDPTDDVTEFLGEPGYVVVKNNPESDQFVAPLQTIEPLLKPNLEQPNLEPDLEQPNLERPNLELGFQPELKSEVEPVVDPRQLSLEELLAAIATLNQEPDASPLALANHYSALGEIYQKQLQEGQASDHRGVWQQAVQAYQKAVALQTQLDAESELSISLLGLGDLYFFFPNDVQAAMSCYQRVLELSRPLGDRLREGQVLERLGQVYQTSKQFDQSVEMFQFALAICQSADHHSPEECLDLRQREGNILQSLGSVYEQLRQYDQMIASLQRSLLIKRELGDRPGEATILSSLAQAYRHLGDHQEVIACQQQNLHIRREVGDRLGEAVALGSLGFAYYTLGDYQKAIEALHQHLYVSRAVGEPSSYVSSLSPQLRQGEANSLNILGNAYRNLGQYQQALGFLQQGLTIVRELGDRQREAATLSNLGIVYRNLGDYPQAVESYKLSLEIKRSIGDRKGESVALGNLGNAYQSWGNYQEALECHRHSLDMKRELGDRKGEANAYFNAGVALEKLNLKTDALESYQNAYHRYQEMGFDEDARDCEEAIQRLS